jgi:hypothetical protein
MTPEVPIIPDGATTMQITMIAVGWIVTVLIPGVIAIYQRIKLGKAEGYTREALNAATYGYGAIELAHRYAKASGDTEKASAIEDVKSYYDGILRRAAPRVDVIDAVIRDTKREVEAIFDPNDPSPEEPLANALLQSAERRAQILEGKGHVPTRSKLYSVAGRSNA